MPLQADVLLQLWPAALPSPAVLQELLALLANLLPGCEAAQDAFAGTGKGAGGGWSRQLHAMLLPCRMLLAYHYFGMR
jgi:hypothetical protein